MEGRCPYCGDYIEALFDYDKIGEIVICPTCGNESEVEYDEQLMYDDEGNIEDEWPLWSLVKVKK